MALNFIDDLKRAVDVGEFNSEAAKKINEINSLADEKLKTMTRNGQDINDSKLAKSVEEKIKKDSEEYQATHTKEEIEAFTVEYKKKMEEIKKQDIINKQLAILIDIENMVKLSIEDMFSFCDEIDEMILTEFGSKDPVCSALIEKIGDIRKKYFL